ncbi:MAG TPA: (d)CMP kinase [Spirochaetia bacterium]|nr:(d)CMP kinase [Spirochaetia bacterium]HRZ63853.1 (d)CMP kinase [Spirochaetia bacterium]
MVIAIDGPAGSGKSTIARKVAEALGFTYVNSGNLYRALTLRALRSGVAIEDPAALLACAAAARIEYRIGRLFLDGVDVEDSLHSAEVDALVAQVSALPPLRDIVNALVRRIAGSTDAVVEGRDMTTVVFPEARLKFFLDASPEARARRRFDQGVSGASLEEIQKNIEMRDEIDRSKSVGSLKIAPDAEYLDSSHLTIQEVYDKVYAKILLIREDHGR